MKYLLRSMLRNRFTKLFFLLLVFFFLYQLKEINQTEKQRIISRQSNCQVGLQAAELKKETADNRLKKENLDQEERKKIEGERTWAECLIRSNTLKLQSCSQSDGEEQNYYLGDILQTSLMMEYERVYLEEQGADLRLKLSAPSELYGDYFQTYGEQLGLGEQEWTAMGQIQPIYEVGWQYYDLYRLMLEYRFRCLEQGGEADGFWSLLPWNSNTTSDGIVFLLLFCLVAVLLYQVRANKSVQLMELQDRSRMKTLYFFEMTFFLVLLLLFLTAGVLLVMGEGGKGTIQELFAPVLVVKNNFKSIWVAEQAVKNVSRMGISLINGDSLSVEHYEFLMLWQLLLWYLLLQLLRILFLVQSVFACVFLPARKEKGLPFLIGLGVWIILSGRMTGRWNTMLNPFSVQNGWLVASGVGRSSYLYSLLLLLVWNSILFFGMSLMYRKKDRMDN